ncbi:MAG TPA: hypothetical protein VM223_03425, partial [Planctomycetota bacterium]|nr:hypothetical protein [Planctomycetota bacterium]
MRNQRDPDDLDALFRAIERGSIGRARAILKLHPEMANAAEAPVVLGPPSPPADFVQGSGRRPLRTAVEANDTRMV